MLPSLIVGAVVILVMRTVVDGFLPFGEPLVALDRDTVYGGLDTALVLDTGWRGTDGSVLTLDQARALAPAGSSGDSAYEWVTSNFTDVPLGVPGNDVWRVEIRESAVLLLIGTIGLTGAAIVVRRRRPY